MGRAFFVLLLLRPAAPFSAAVGALSPARSGVRASAAPQAYAADWASFRGDPVKIVKSALMSRAVDLTWRRLQIVHDKATASWLQSTWTTYVDRRTGSLTDFLDELQRTERQSVLMPITQFRKLSPGNPYAEQQSPGVAVDVEPSKVAAKLMSCREQLADEWADQLALLSTAMGASPAAGADAPSCASTADAAADEQLLRGLATRLAARQLLNELAMLPSQAHVYDWLSSFLLCTHAVDLTVEGCVERLLEDLAAQPLHIRGGALVDPLEIERDLVRRTAEITERMALALRDARDEHSSVQASFLESCLRL